MTTTSTGRRAEQAAAEFLIRHGLEILELNWKTRFCEIDIVARQGTCAHFVEVKYRTTDMQGPGLDYVTRGKLRRMHFAAEAWMLEHHWNGDANLAAIEVCAPDYAIGEFVPYINIE